MEWSLGETELASMRAEMVVASRIGELEPPVDTVFIHIREHDAFRASCDLVRDLGFEHVSIRIGARQIGIYPDRRATRFRSQSDEAFAEAEAAGSASIQIDGYFVDYPIVDKAQRIVDIAEAIALKRRDIEYR